ncbi:MAG: ribonuclease III [Chloroflexi bacterium]|nr:ribonuclease III [Chloroflexota bacterium]
MSDAQGFRAAELPEDFAHRLGLTFSDYGLLARALTHRSFANENDDVLEDNERLEFLGDAVLDFMVGAWLYERFPEMREGELTRLRSALVRTEQLAAFAQQINLGAAIRLGRGESEGGGRERQALLCATFEALVGAMYLSDGFRAVEVFMQPILDQATDDLAIERAEQDPKSLLQERIQARRLDHPIYRTVDAYGPDHAKVFEVEVLVDGKALGHGSGHSKQAATKAAARDALSRLDFE